jgi:diacylglycerol O-acyltransferase / wax synthase
MRRCRESGNGGYAPIERLTAPDLMLIWPERMGWTQDIGAIVILDGGPLLGANGDLQIERIRDHIERRLHLVRRFRQTIVWPRLGLGWPLWVDDPSFDISQHVDVFPVAPPGGDAEILRACEELRRRRLRGSRPLWEMWLLTGLPKGRLGLFIRLHHAVADGVAGVAALGTFVDVLAAPPAAPAPPWRPLPMPSRNALLRDNLRRRLHELEGTLRALLRPVHTARILRRAWPATRELFAEGKAPRTSFNQRIGSDRRLSVVRSTLDGTKQVAHAYGAKMNDVLLTAVAGGYRELLRGRGESVDGLVLRAFVPVSLHQEQPGSAQGNLDAGMVVPLPIGEHDDVTRLEGIAADMAERRKKSRPPAGSMFRNVLLQRAFLRLMPRQRFMNTYVANVPGPPLPLYFAGAPVIELFPVVPITANVSIGVGAMSYADQFNMTVVVDRQLCPDIATFVDGMRSSLDALNGRVAVRLSPQADPLASRSA